MSSPVPDNGKPRTRLVATVGPTCNSPKILHMLARAGASVYRLNFSHGSHEEHAEAIRLIRAISEEVKRPLGILADLSGPKLRIGPVPEGEVSVKEGEIVRLTSQKNICEPRRFSVNIDAIHELVKPGRRVLLDDGTVRLEAEAIEDLDVICRATADCVIRSRKGINLPGTHLPIPALTEKDRSDLVFALDQKVDFIALSFVRRVCDLRMARNAMEEHGTVVPLIAKIEMADALEVLDELMNVADGAMVARGDLGVEIPVEEVPGVQRRVIQICHRLGKPVITATQMLNSMINNPVPTRAEVTDIYNAIAQGSDAVMLSGETANGQFPVQSLEMMCRVAREAEKDMSWSWDWDWEPDQKGDEALAEAICSAAVQLAQNLQLDAIVCATSSGETAVRVARYRPKCKVLAFSILPRVVNRMSLCWGVQSRAIRELWASEEEAGESSSIINVMLQKAREEGMVSDGMRVVVVAGLPLGSVTNLLRIVEISEGRYH